MINHQESVCEVFHD